jgi:hypothetical protein
MGGIGSRYVRGDQPSVKVFANGALTADFLPLRENLDICLLPGREIDRDKLAEIGAHIAVDGDHVMARYHIAIKGAVGFRDAGNLTV